MRKTVRGKKRELGITSKCKLKKNRVKGQEHSVEIPIYHSLGIDDIGSCVDYLVSEKHWPGKAGRVNAKDFEFVGPREKVIRYIESEGLERPLKQLVSDVWSEIEEESKIKRKGKYDVELQDD